MGAINIFLHVGATTQHLKFFHHFLHFRSLSLRNQLLESKICCNNKFMENQIYNGFPNYKKLITYQKNVAMSKLIDGTINMDFNRDGFVVFCILLHES
jgi:gamma-glutamylcysteine synthetase